MGAPVQVGERDMQRLVLWPCGRQGLGHMIDNEHENEAKDHGNANVSMGAFHVGSWRGCLFLFFRPMNACMALLVAFGRVIVSAPLRLGMVIVGLGLLLLFLLLRGAQLVAVWRQVGRVAHKYAGHFRGLTSRHKVGLRGHAFVLSVHLHRGDLGLGVRDVVGIAHDGGAVHGLDAFWNDDNERCAHEDAGAKQRHGAKLAWREAEREREDAGQERAEVVSLDEGQNTQQAAGRRRGTHAMAMMVLRASSMKSPSHMADYRWPLAGTMEGGSERKPGGGQKMEAGVEGGREGMYSSDERDRMHAHSPSGVGSRGVGESGLRLALTRARRLVAARARSPDHHLNHHRKLPWPTSISTSASPPSRRPCRQEPTR